VERFLTIFWLLLIPTQLGRHFWLAESSVMGVRIDYLSIILYFTDIAWLGWIMSKLPITNYQLLITNLKLKTKKLLSFQNFILLLLVVVNIIFSEAKWVAVYRWLRIGQWWLTWQMVKENKNIIIGYLKYIIPVWIILETFLGLSQVIKGGSLNGIFWWLGERRFTYGGIGIAQIRLFDEGWIRAYGTFSHPNSLAGFLLLAWWWWKKQKFKIIKIFYWVVNWSAILGIILTGSRTIWGLTLGMLMASQWQMNDYRLLMKDDKLKRQLIGKTFLFLGIICLILGVVSINYKISDFVGGWDVNGFQKREMLGLSTIKMIRENPLFGVGAGNFMVNLPKYQTRGFYWMQPVHNIFLLIWSEIGILGIIMFLILGANRLRVFNGKKQFWFLLIVGITGMLDHYWLTLPQNTWLLAIMLGLI